MSLKFNVILTIKQINGDDDDDDDDDGNEFVG